MSYLGNSPTDQSFVATVDYFNGDGVTVAFTLSRQVASVAQVQAVIENVPQNPSSAFTLMGNVITFTSAPPSGSANIYVYYTSPNTKVMAPSAGTVDRTALAAAAVTSVKMANGGAEFGMRNRIINGDMRIDQRNAGASVTPTNQAYTVDRWSSRLSQASKYTVQQNAGSVTPPFGFTNYLGVTSSSAYSVVNGDYFFQEQFIEGLNCADLAWGTANAATVTLTFKVRSSLTGTFGGAVCNSGASRSYPFSFTISSANTWEEKSITIAGDTSGTWLTTNGVGINIRFSLGAGSTYSGTANTWAGANYVQPTGATSVVGTSGATFYITGVQLEKGTLATPFEYRPYGAELALCQRYFELMDYTDTQYNAVGNSTRWATSNDQWCALSYKVLKRSTPSVSSVGTVILYGAGSTATATPTYQYIGPYALCMRVQPVTYTVDYGFVGNNSGFKISVSAEL